MEKAKVLAVAKETRVVTQKDGTNMQVLEVYLGTERDGVEGYVPSARTVTKKATGEVFAFCGVSVPLSGLGTYRPKVGDLVNVEYGRYDRIIGLSKIN